MSPSTTGSFSSTETPPVFPPFPIGGHLPDKTPKNPKDSPETKDLPPKKVAGNEEENVKGGFEPVNTGKLGFDPVNERKLQ